MHIEDPNVEFDDSYSVYSKVQIDNKLSSYAQTSDIPTKVSQLDNDLGFITSGVVPTNYVTVNTAQDITAAKTFKNNTDTTKIDGKEIIISGTETYNVSGAGAGTNYPNSPSSVTATTETKIDYNTISYNGNSIGYYRNYYPTQNQSSDPAYVSYNDGIEIKTKSYDTVYCTGDVLHSWFRLTLSNSDNDSYFSGLELIVCSTVNDDQAITENTIFSVNANESIFNSAVTFSQYVTVDGDYLRIQDHGEYTRISEYVKQASLFYNMTNSVITATSDTVIEPSSNNAISLGTSTNKLSNIYATTFNGDLNGNASSATTATTADHAISADSATTADYATKATQDGNGKTISSYYCTLSTEQTISGKKIFYGGNIDFILGDNNRNISFRYDPTYQSWTWITCYNGNGNNYITLHFTNNNTDVIQLTHTCTSESVNNTQKVKSLVTKPSVDNVWQLGDSDKRLSNIYTTELSLTSYAVTNGTYHPRTLSTGNYGIHSNADICPISELKNNLGNEQCRWSRVYVGFVGSYDYPVASTYTKNLYLPSGSNSNLVSLPDYLTGSYDSSGSFTTGVAANVGAIRLLYVEIPSGSSSIGWAEPGTQITNKSFKGYSYTVGIAAFHANSSDGSVQVLEDFTDVTGTWRMLSAVKLEGNASTARKIPFLAIRVA